VLAVDLDFFFGDMTYGLGCRTDSTLKQAIADGHARDGDSIRKYIVTTESGVHLLSAPGTPSPGALNKKDVLNMLQALQPAYDVIIVDLPVAMDVLRDRIMEETGKLVMVISNDFQAVRAGGIYLEALKNSNFPMNRVHIVYNRVSGSDGVTVDEFSRLVKFPLFSEIPHDRRTVNEAYLACVPYALPGRSTIFHETELLVSKLVSHRPS